MKLSRYWLMCILVCLIGSPILAAESFVTFREVTEKGKVIPLSSDQSYYNVDINSYIDVDFAPKMLVGESQVLNSPESKALRTELANLAQLLTEAEEQLAHYVQEIQTLHSQLTTDPDPDPKVRKQFLAVLNQHGRLISSILDQLEPVVGTKALEDALLSPDPTYEDLLALLRQRIKVVQGQLEEEVHQLLAERQLYLRVWCIQKGAGKKPTAIHLDNYDDLEQGTFQSVDKVTFVMSDAEQKHLQNNLDMYQKLQSSLDQIGQHGQNLGQVLEQLEEQLFIDLREVTQQLVSHSLVTLVQNTQQKLDQLASSPAVEELQTSLAQLRTDLNQIAELQTQLLHQLDELRDSMHGENLLLHLDEFFTQLGELEKLAHHFQQSLQRIDLSQVQQHLVALVEKVQAEESQIPKELAGLFQQLTTTLTKSWLEQFAKLGDQLAELNLATYSSSFQGLIERLHFSQNLATPLPHMDEWVPEEIRKVQLIDAPSTSIDIPWTQRQTNDLYFFNVQVRSEKSLVYEERYTFRIKEFGLSSKWVTNLAVMKEPTSSTFRPVTAVTWVLHYQGRSAEIEEAGMGLFLQTLKPGVGMTSILYSGNQQFEQGLGVAVTMLNDRLQVGYGVKFLDAGEGRKDFFFIGTSLFNLLTPSMN